MILQSRKWRMLIRIATLLITTVLILAFAGPASYALQDDTPKLITTFAQLSNKDEPLTGTYVKVKGVPDLNSTLSTKEWTDTVYWIPLSGYDNQVIVRTNDSRYLFPYDYDPAVGFLGVSDVEYSGKVVTLKSEADADKLVKELAAQGITVDKEKAMVLDQGEAPKNFRPMVPVIPVLAWLWLAALVGLIQIVRRRTKQRWSEAARAATQTR